MSEEYDDGYDSKTSFECADEDKPEHIEPREPETNIEFVTRIMNFCPTGALSQVFVIDAIGKFAKRAATADFSDWPESHPINKDAWKRTAEFIHNEMEKKYGR